MMGTFNRRSVFVTFVVVVMVVLTIAGIWVIGNDTSPVCFGCASFPGPLVGVDVEPTVLFLSSVNGSLVFENNTHHSRFNGTIENALLVSLTRTDAENQTAEFNVGFNQTGPLFLFSWVAGTGGITSNPVQVFVPPFGTETVMLYLIVNPVYSSVPPGNVTGWWNGTISYGLDGHPMDSLTLRAHAWSPAQ